MRRLSSVGILQCFSWLGFLGQRIGHPRRGGKPEFKEGRYPPLDVPSCSDYSSFFGTSALLTFIEPPLVLPVLLLCDAGWTILLVYPTNPFARMTGVPYLSSGVLELFTGYLKCLNVSGVWVDMRKTWILDSFAYDWHFVNWTIRWKTRGKVAGYC